MSSGGDMINLKGKNDKLQEDILCCVSIIKNDINMKPNKKIPPWKVHLLMLIFY